MWKVSSKILVFERWRHQIGPKLIFPAVEQRIPSIPGKQRISGRWPHRWGCRRTQGRRELGLQLWRQLMHCPVYARSWLVGHRLGSCDPPCHQAAGKSAVRLAPETCLIHALPVITWKDSEMDFIVIKWHQNHLSGNIHVYFSPCIF